jgi:hypothetical protein
VLADRLSRLKPPPRWLSDWLPLLTPPRAGRVEALLRRIALPAAKF